MKIGYRHQCDQCGKIEPWNSCWRRYSSIRHDETCPELMPDLCSEACRKLFLARIEKGEVRLPELSNHGYYSSLRKAGSGYGAEAGR